MSAGLTDEHTGYLNVFIYLYWISLSATQAVLSGGLF